MYYIESGRECVHTIKKESELTKMQLRIFKAKERDYSFTAQITQVQFLELKPGGSQPSAILVPGELMLYSF